MLRGAFTLFIKFSTYLSKNRLSDSSWIREICRIPNETIVLEKNDSESTKTKVSLVMARNALLKDRGAKSSRLRSRVARKELELSTSSTTGKPSENSHNCRDFQRRRRESNSARKAKCKANERLRVVHSAETSEFDKM
jgi:hypothetical protein